MPENKRPTILLIQFLDEETRTYEFHRDGRPSTPASWRTDHRGLIVKYPGAGNRVVIPWHNVRMYQVQVTDVESTTVLETRCPNSRSHDPHEWQDEQGNQHSCEGVPL